MDRLVKLEMGLLLAACCAGAAAQVADPTLPPPGLDALAAGAEAPPAPPPGPELQSILVSREAGGRRIAVISGEMVRQGSRFQGAVVESVGEDCVVLRRGKARETLRLYSPQQAQQQPLRTAQQKAPQQMPQQGPQQGPEQMPQQQRAPGTER